MEEKEFKPWHLFVDQDAQHIVKRHATTVDTVTERRRAFAALQSRFAKYAGGRFKVIDVSPYTYAIDTNETALQFALRDSQPYDAEQALMHAEYSTTPVALQGLIQTLNPPDGLIAYPSSQHDHLVPPIHTHRDGFYYEVHPPSPFHEPLLKFFKTYVRLYPNLGLLLPLLDIWLASHDIPSSELSPACFALLFIAYLQSEHQLPALVEPQQSSGVWWPTRLPNEGEVPPLNNKLEPLSDWCVLDLVAPLPNLPVFELRAAPLAPILFGFFKFCVALVPSKHLISNQKPPLLLRTLRANASSTTITDQRPLAWKNDVLVVVDPFLFTHNHAYSLSKETWLHLLAACKTSAHRLSETAPLHTIFGSAFDALPRNPDTTVQLNPMIVLSVNHMMQAQNPISVFPARRRTIKAVENAIQGSFGGRYSVVCFGSTIYGVDSPTSDLDMVIMDSSLPQGFHPNVDERSLPDPYNMRKVRPVLQKAGFIRVVPITGATVPIVKFVDPRTRLNIDLNCNNRLGSTNTELLTGYCDMWPPLRSMIVFVKKWAKSMSLNDPSGETGPASFSSYCLTLMTVAFLQGQGVLPNLQASAVGYVDQNSSGFWLLLKKNKRLWCDTRYEKPFGWRGVPMAIDQAIYRWFRFFAYQHLYPQNILDIKEGGIRPRQRPHIPPDIPAAQKKRSPKTSKSAPSAGPSSVAAGSDLIEEIAQDVDDDLGEDDTDETLQTTNELDGLDLDSSEPLEWTKSWLVVVDPFIRVKNCANACTPRVQDRFQQECQRAVSLLEAGEPMEALFGLGGPLFHGNDGRPRRPGRGPRQRGPKNRGPAPQGGQTRAPTAGTKKA